MKFLSLDEWKEACKLHHPKMILESHSAVGYWRSSNSEHYWRLIPISWGLFTDHKMMETTLVEELERKFS